MFNTWIFTLPWMGIFVVWGLRNPILSRTVSTAKYFQRFKILKYLSKYCLYEFRPIYTYFQAIFAKLFQTFSEHLLYDLSWNDLILLLKSTILVIIFWDILMFYQIFLSPQVKRIVIISNKNDIYELPNDLRLRILGN